VVFQSNNLWPGLSAVENLIALTRLAGLDNVDERVRDALAAFGLSARAGQPAGMLSGGEQQRAAIAAAAARHAPLVLADEPTGELDVTMEGAVLEAFQELRSEFGAAAVMVTHSARVADAADRVVELKDGKVVL
jgi:putative ABC transport system ATP-binding protein